MIEVPGEAQRHMRAPKSGGQGSSGNAQGGNCSGRVNGEWGGWFPRYPDLSWLWFQGWVLEMGEGKGREGWSNIGPRQ